MIFVNHNTSSWEFHFLDSPAGGTLDQYSVYTSRKLSSFTSCTAENKHKSIPEETKTASESEGGDRSLVKKAIFSTDLDHDCGPRYSIAKLQEFWSDDTKGWYYKCNITLGYTQNDPLNISFVSDSMAKIATASPVHPGEVDGTGNTSQTVYDYNADAMGFNGSFENAGCSLAVFALGSIVGATINNHYVSYFGLGQQLGSYFHVGSRVWFM